MTKPVNAVPAVVDDVDDFCSCSESIYHSFIDPVVDVKTYPSPQLPDVPSEPLISPSSVDMLDPLTMKAKRSSECARQRLKKPMDVAKSKRHPVSSCTCCRPYKVAKSNLRSSEASWTLRWDVTEAKVDAKLTSEGNREFVETPRSLAGIPTRKSDTVSLMDLMKPPSRSAEKRFELISRPRQVLALDDFTEIDSDRYDLDDWEHIPLPNQAKPSRRSYAKVVAARA